MHRLIKEGFNSFSMNNPLVNELTGIYAQRMLVGVLFVIVGKFCSNQVQLWMALLLLSTFGLMHGANDIFLLQRKAGQKLAAISPFKIHLFYILSIVLVLLVFIQFSTIGLLLFFALSAFHFGEQHFTTTTVRHSKYASVLHLSYGLGIISNLIALNSTEALVNLPLSVNLEEFLPMVLVVCFL